MSSSSTFNCAALTYGTTTSRTLWLLSTASNYWFPSLTTTGARFTNTYTFAGSATNLNLQQYNTLCGTAGLIVIVPPTTQTFTCYTKTTCNIDLGYFALSPTCDDPPNLSFTLTDTSYVAFTIPLSI